MNDLLIRRIEIEKDVMIAADEEIGAVYQEKRQYDEALAFQIAGQFRRRWRKRLAIGCGSPKSLTLSRIEQIFSR
jgi:hypothetical protein